jgi:hypothetical protein
LIIVIYYYANTSHIYEYALTGFWVGSDKFCEDSNVDAVLLYIGEYSSGQRHIHLIIPDVVNEGFVFKYGRPWMRSGSVYELDVTSDCSIWDKKLSVKLDLSRGSLCIFDEDNLLAELYRSDKL